MYRPVGSEAKSLDWTKREKGKEVGERKTEGGRKILASHAQKTTAQEVRIQGKKL